jgi:hypothetical protein
VIWPNWAELDFLARLSSQLRLFPTMASHSHPSSTANLVGVHYRVGKKIGEGSFGVIFEGNQLSSVNLSSQLTYRKGTNLLNSQTVAIKFVRFLSPEPSKSAKPRFLTTTSIPNYRSPEKLKPRSSGMNVARIAYWPDVVSIASFCSIWVPCMVSDPLHSRNSANLPLWTGRPPQHPRD